MLNLKNKKTNYKIIIAEFENSLVLKQEEEVVKLD